MVTHEETTNTNLLGLRYHDLVHRLKTAETRFNRIPGSVCLVAVSKKQVSDSIRTINSLGQNDFGENQLQESLIKIRELSHIDLNWHFIGAIQTNKCKDIAINFNWVHSIDRLKIADRLSAFRPITSTPLNIFVQVNLQREPNKSGVDPADLLQLATEVVKLPNLRVRGLMTIPKPDPDFEQQRQIFKELRQMQFELNQALNLNLQCLSMGMTNDLEAAVAEGATHIRIGTGVFGSR